jgi:NADH dehydrogenase
VILVTGGAGFVGGHVVHELRRRELPVRCLVRDSSDKAAGRLSSWGCELVDGDMTDAESLRRAVDGVDRVVHLVAIRQGKDEQFRRVMVEGTASLLHAAKEAEVRRFVHMSALGTSEETKDLVPYYRAKWDTELLVKSSDIPWVIFRPSFVFAADGGILPTFVKLARLAPVTPIVGSGKQRIQPIWADDVATYFADAVERDDVTDRIVELGGPDVVSWDEFWERLKRVRGQRRPSVHVPMGLMKINALVTERLPGDIPLTRDLLKMLDHGDNVVTDPEPAALFDVSLVPLDEQLRRAA